MATSGTDTFNLTRDQLITLSYQLLGIATEGRALTNYELQLGVTVLNCMIKSWAADGRYLWKAQQLTLFLVYGQVEYVLDGVSSNVAYTDEVAQTSLSADFNSGITEITVDSTDGMAVDDYIGIYLTNTDTSTNYLFWTTITAIDSGTLTVTIADSLPYSATSGNEVFAYTTNVGRVLAISDAYTEYTSSVSRYPITIISREEYWNEITQPTTISRPQQLFYDLELTNGQIWLWPAPEDVTQVVGFTADIMFDDVGIATNNLDFPPEWLRALYYNLAVDLSDFYGIGQERFARIQEKAKEAYALLRTYNRERYTSVIFTPDFNRS